MKLIGIRRLSRVGVVALIVAGLVAGCTASVQPEAKASVPTTTVSAAPPQKTPSTPAGPEAKLDQTIKPDAYHCGNGGNGVLLVFDDFPMSKKLYKQLIDVAKENNAGIGVAPNGTYVKSGRVDVGYAHKKGMLVVDHAFYHDPPFMELPYGSPTVKGSLVWQITRPYNGSNYVRPPYGSPFYGKLTKARKAAQKRVLKAFKAYGKVNCLWNLDPEDWNHKSPKAAADYIIKHAFKGATAVVHMNHLGTQPKLIPYIQKGLAKRGLKLCRPWSTPTPKKMPNRYC